MALVVSTFCGGEEKERRSSSFRKPWMLKDYLGDDLSSCSSNGFRSFPRRQCCAAVRGIIEKEVIRNGRNNNTKKRMLVKNRSISSTLQRASMAVINAVKLLPFNSPAKNAVDSGEGKRFLPRSFSKKLFRRSFFWKKERSNNVVVVRKKKKDDHDDEIERWISSGVVGKEKYQPSDLSNDTTVTMTSVSNNSDGKSDSSWSDLTFTSDSLTCSSENDTVERREKMEEVSKRVGVIAGEDSVEPAVAKENMWFNEEVEKEQSSPISVLDFPYNNEEEGSSPFTLRVSRLKGTKERLMEKLGRFECLAGLEPINLESLISSQKIEDRSPKHSILPCSTPSYILSSESEEDEEEDEEEEEESHESEVERQAQQLLIITKSRIPSKNYNFELFENVLLDFFRENVTQKANESLLQAAEGWINGHYDTLILGWEVKDKRQAYIKDMEEGGWWPRDTTLETEEVATKLGDEVMAHLIDELMVEYCSS
ncbi:hypothetical protein SOVF_093640 [Spinacia oleracea]|uniref:DUF4378 domain-containing protein n=1 Tax=Spinacia oleracea TaxID=3562 RepID=A0A9R0JRH7_SPIOL|nr:uncharacterized protein LOC110784320 [Spinacia oleracea]KNA15962.1 hypothetical protein SOVF_093640 [Spinacia oleracea]